MVNESDIHLVELVLAGKNDAFAVLVDRYKDMVFTMAVGLMRHREEAEEVAQDAFLKVFKALPKFQGKSKFSTWMYRIVYNECISRLRRKKANLVSIEDVSYKEVPDEWDENGPEWAQQEARKRTLHEAMQQLPEQDKTIVMLYYFENCQVEDISAITSLSTSNVKTKLFRARKKLHSALVHVKKKELIEY